VIATILISSQANAGFIPWGHSHPNVVWVYQPLNTHVALSRDVPKVIPIVEEEDGAYKPQPGNEGEYVEEPTEDSNKIAVSTKEETPSVLHIAAHPIYAINLQTSSALSASDESVSTLDASTKVTSSSDEASLQTSSSSSSSTSSESVATAEAKTKNTSHNVRSDGRDHRHGKGHGCGNGGGIKPVWSDRSE